MIILDFIWSDSKLYLIEYKLIGSNKIQYDSIWSNLIPFFPGRDWEIFSWDKRTKSYFTIKSSSSSILLYWTFGLISKEGAKYHETYSGTSSI